MPQIRRVADPSSHGGHPRLASTARPGAEEAFGRFLAKYQAKYKAAYCLAKDREVLLAFYAFPAEHWKHIRTTDEIESTFATVRLRTDQNKGLPVAPDGLGDGLQACQIDRAPLVSPGRLRAARQGDPGRSLPRRRTTGRGPSPACHEVRLMPPAYVKAYVRRQKNDMADAAAICESVTRPSMRFVPIKSEAQQALLLIHRARDLLVRQRTSLINALRAHLAEFGVVLPKGASHGQKSP